MGQKNPKGSVSIVNEAGRIRLRWRYQKQRYSLNLFHYSKAGILQAKKIALTIEQDMVAETFDSTLNKYNPKRLVSQPEHVVSTQEQKSIPELFSEWVRQYRNMNPDKDGDYFFTRRMLERWGDFTLSEAIGKLNTEAVGFKTYNLRLRILKNFCVWAVKAKFLDWNPFEEVIPKKVNKTPKTSRKPFSEQEISQILEAFKKDSYCPPSSRYKHSFYYPFVYFIFKMGVRNAEAVGLRVKHLDFVNNVVEIKEAMARTLKGTHSAARIRKETKNGKERKLPLDEETSGILKPLLEGKEPDDLVFQSPNGLLIDDRMFQRRVFRRVLKGLKIEVRVLYACRHTFGSRCIHDGLTPVMTAFLMGNNPETALRNYTHLIELPKQLPSISH